MLLLLLHIIVKKLHREHSDNTQCGLNNIYQRTIYVYSKPTCYYCMFK